MGTTNNIDALEFADEELKNDEQFVLRAVRNLPSSFEFASDELKSNYQFVLKVFNIEINHHTYDGTQWVIYALRFCSDELLSNKEFIIDAIQIGPVFNYIPSFMLKDEDVILELLMDGDQMQVDDLFTYINSKKFMLKAIRKSANLLQHASDELRNDKDFIIAAVKANNIAFDFLDSKFKSDKDVVFAAANSKNITKVKIPSSYQEHFKKDRHNN